jgi:hypothetical protein
MTDQKKRKRGIHTAVVLEPEVLERLRKSKEGVSFEIRERIRRTLEQDTFDGRTLSLANLMMRVAEDIRRHTGTPWHATKKGRQAIVAAFEQLVDSLPVGTTVPEDTFGPDDPSTLGRAIARTRMQFPNPFGRVEFDPAGGRNVTARDENDCDGVQAPQAPELGATNPQEEI